MELAPVILFVYNRPVHTRQTLDALSENDGAADTVLYIFADGPKSQASADDIKKIQAVRAVIREKKWCKEIVIIEREKNLGLAESVISGVTEVIKNREAAIVLEDDLVTSKGFLSFMNQGLQAFRSSQVAGITGWSFDIGATENYFSRIGSCWGWATWKEHWLNINFNVSDLINEFSDNKLIDAFNADNRYPYFQLLRSQQTKKVDSWAIRFYADYFLKKKLFYHPSRSLVQNIGGDGSGTHSRINDHYNEPFNINQRVDVNVNQKVEELHAIRQRIVNSPLYNQEVLNTPLQKLMSATKRLTSKILNRR